MITEKNKLVELYHYPGYHEEEMTPLPNGIELNAILEKVIRAQSKTVVGKVVWTFRVYVAIFLVLEKNSRERLTIYLLALMSIST